MDKQLDSAEIVKELRNYEYWCGSSGKYARDIHPHICERAADMIEFLQAENRSLRKSNELFECDHANAEMNLSHLNDLLTESRARERAAISHIRRDCDNCKHWRPGEERICVAPGDTPCTVIKRQAWEWNGRGPGEGETE